tara:strand:+ start:4904 stop:5893 length:990 start_codon:yes stop_codon:yes gene_type:complete
MFNDKSILVTGATGSFGQRFVSRLLEEHNPSRVVIFSRDELKQFEMQQKLQSSKLRYFLGDVRDKSRLHRAFQGVEIVIHAAAMKQVPASEYNPMEAVKTNIIGAENVINVAIDQKIEKVLALSTDKASNPANLYGATKLCADKLFTAANVLSGFSKTKFSVVRYGNVINSRGSIVPFLKNQKKSGIVTLTDERMTRFWITLDQGVDFVAQCLSRMKGGEIFIPKIPSMSVVDVIKAIAPDCKVEIIGIRPGEKIHETMITSDDAISTIEFDNYYVIIPSTEHKDLEKYKNKKFKFVEPGFSYSSDNNSDWLTIEQFNELVSDSEHTDN